jgi:hypothetical protein
MLEMIIQIVYISAQGGCRQQPDLQMTWSYAPARSQWGRELLEREIGPAGFCVNFCSRVTAAAAVTKKLSLLEWLEVTSVTFCPLFRHDPKNWVRWDINKIHTCAVYSVFLLWRAIWIVLPQATSSTVFLLLFLPKWIYSHKMLLCLQKIASGVLADEYQYKKLK